MLETPCFVRAANCFLGVRWFVVVRWFVGVRGFLNLALLLQVARCGCDPEDRTHGGVKRFVMGQKFSSFVVVAMVVGRESW